MGEYLKGAMFEGIGTSGKTTTMLELKKLQTENMNNERSLIVLSEQYSQVLNSVSGKVISMEQNAHIELLGKRIEMIEQLNEYACSLGSDYSLRARGLFVIFERFYLNHIKCFNNFDNDKVINLAKRINKLGLKNILLTISDDNIINRLKARNPNIFDGMTKEEITLKCNARIKEQNTLIETAKQSHIPTLIINTDSLEWEKYAKSSMEYTQTN